MHKHKRKIGQVFLINKKKIKKIIDNISFSRVIFEIGCGYGNLTDFFIKKKHKIVLLELDKKIFIFLKKKYKKYKNINIINENIINFKFKFKKKITLISNIPYYLTNKIIFLLIKNKNIINNLNIMVQREYYLNKIKKSKFKFLIKYNYTIKKKFLIENFNFFPKPKINSIFLFMYPIKRNKKFNAFFNKKILKQIKNYLFFKFFNLLKKKKLCEVIIFYCFIYKNSF
ncbi:rRNA adenine N-6-methyltransferase family protein [Candidatus Vidania fulgoroideorum]